MNASRLPIHFTLGLAAAGLAVPACADTIGLGTVWNTNAMTGQANSGSTVGFWAPNNVGSVIGFTLTPNGTGLNNGGTSSGTVYLQSLVGVNPTSGIGTAGFLTIIDTTTSTVVGSSINSVTSVVTTSPSHATTSPWQFNNLALDAGTRYAFVFTSTAGTPGTPVNAVGADGSVYNGDIDPSAGVLNAVNYRIGGGANNGSNLIAGSGALINSGSLPNYEQWFSAAFTTTSQALVTLDSGAGTTTQSGAGSWTGIRKIGTGTYVLNNTGNANTGDIVVENGVLRLDTAASGSTSSLVGGAGQIFLAHSNGGATAVSQNSTAMSGSILEVNTSAGNAALDTAVEGAGRLVKTGANTLTVTANSSYTGGVRVDAGTLSVSSIANKGVDSPLGRGNSSNSSLVLAGGTLAYTGSGDSTDRILGVSAGSGNTLSADGLGSVSFTSTSTIGFNGLTGARTLLLTGANTGNNTLANVLADNGGATTLEKSGVGKWILSGNNTHTGGVVINAGILQMGAGGTSGTLGSGPVSVAGTLAFNRTDGSPVVVANNLSGAGLITHTGSEVSLTGVNSFSGTLQIDGGTLALQGINSENGAPAVVVNAAGNLSLGNDFAGQTATISSLSGAGGVNPQFDNATGTRTLAINQSGNTVYSGIARDATSGATRILAITKQGAGTLVFSGPNTYSGGTVISQGVLQMGNGGTSGTLGSGPVTVDATLAFNRSDSGIVTVANNLSGAGLITHSAPQLTLTGVNSFSGTLQINSGSLVLQGINSENGSPAVVVGASGNLVLGNDFAGQSATISSLSGSGGVNPQFDAATGTRTLAVNQSGNTVYSGIARDATSGASRVLALTKQGSGTLVLAGANSYSGGTVISQGILQMGNGGTAGTLGSGPVTVDATLAFNRSDSGVIQVANNLSGAGLITHSAPQLALTGVNTFSGTLQIDSGTLALRGIDSENGSPAVVINAGGNLSLGSGFAGQTATISSLSGSGGVNPQFDSPTGIKTLAVNQAGNTTFSGIARDATTGSRFLALTKDGSGTLTLSGGNTYTGPTTISGGSVALSGAGALSDATAVNLSAAGTTFSISGITAASETIGSLAGVSGSGVVLGGKTLVAGGNNGTTTFAGTLSGTGDFQKTGTGALTLSGVNTHTGKTTISGGSVVISALNNLGADPATPTPDQLRLNGGTLEVTGTLNWAAGNRGIAIGPAVTTLPIPSGTFQLNAGTLTVANAIEGANGNLRKSGAGTFNLTANAILNGLFVDQGRYIQSTGVTSIGSTSSGLQIASTAVYELSGGTLRTDAITVASGGTFQWGAARLTVASTQGSAGTADFTDAAYAAVRAGTTLAVSGDLDTGAGSILQLHNSPTFYLNGGVRFNNLSVAGDLNLGGLNDALEVAISPYLLRPFSPSFGPLATDFGSIPLVVVQGGAITGTFDSFTGVTDDGRGFSPHVGAFTSASALSTDTWHLEYVNNVVNPTGFAPGTYSFVYFHYKVTGYVPEPDTFLLGLFGAAMLRYVRRIRGKPAV